MTERQKTKIIFMGSADFSVPILLALIKKFSVIAVVTEIDKPAGRNKTILPPPTKRIAQQQGIPVYQPLSFRKDLQLIEKIRAMAPDLIVVAAYGKILPEALLNVPLHGCLNVHPSLLPKYRGASPIQSALLAGEKVTGTTVMLMDPCMDTGDIVAQEEMEIEDGIGYRELMRRLSLQSAELLTKIIPRYIAGDVNLTTQKDGEATYCKKISKADGRIDWRESAAQISNQIRAYSAWPGAFTTFKEKKLDVVEAQAAENIKTGHAPGAVFCEGKKYYVACGEGALELKRVKLEGKKEVDCQSFVNGYRDFVGAVLE